MATSSTDVKTIQPSPLWVIKRARVKPVGALRWICWSLKYEPVDETGSSGNPRGARTPACRVDTRVDATEPPCVTGCGKKPPLSRFSCAPVETSRWIPVGADGPRAFRARRTAPRAALQAAAASSVRMRTRLYAAAPIVNIHPTRARPRCRTLRSSATLFSHPKISSIRLRFR